MGSWVLASMALWNSLTRVERNRILCVQEQLTGRLLRLPLRADRTRRIVGVLPSSPQNTQKGVDAIELDALKECTGLLRRRERGRQDVAGRRGAEQAGMNGWLCLRICHLLRGFSLRLPRSGPRHARLQPAPAQHAPLFIFIVVILVVSVG